MELYPGVHQIQSVQSGRNIFQYLFTGERAVLVDCGFAHTPERTIFPYMDSIDLDPANLALAVITHADADHQGGCSRIRQTAPSVLLACGEADRRMIEDPQALWDLRYTFLNRDHGLSLAAGDPWPEAGRKQGIDLGFTGGEKIRLADDWELDVLHVPGHSHGHLALYDSKCKAVFAGDAIHGRGCPNSDGSPGMPVTYYFVDLYLSTLQHFENLPIDVLYSGHWPIMRGEEVRDFIADSRRIVEQVDRIILRALDSRNSGLDLRELTDVVADGIGEWPKESWQLAAIPVKGHLDRLEQNGTVRRQLCDGRLRWR